MAQVTVILSILKHNFVLTLGGEIVPEADDEDESKEIVVIDSSGDHQIRAVGFVRNEDEDDEEDAYRVRV